MRWTQFGYAGGLLSEGKPENVVLSIRKKKIAVCLSYLCIRQNGSCWQMRWTEFGYAGGLLSGGEPENLANHNIGK